MNKEIVVLIGGPSSGKTTLIEALKEKGHTCYPEISREVIREAQEQGIEQLFLENPLLFSELLLEGRKKQFLSAQNEAAPIVFLDRGIPDVLAYMNYNGDAYPAFFDQACKDHVYTTIFVLPPWKEIYISDSERYENYEQAVLIHEHLMETYEKYGYSIVLPKKSSSWYIVDFILNQLAK